MSSVRIRASTTSRGSDGTMSAIVSRGADHRARRGDTSGRCTSPSAGADDHLARGGVGGLAQFLLDLRDARAVTFNWSLACWRYSPSSP